MDILPNEFTTEPTGLEPRHLTSPNKGRRELCKNLCKSELISALPLIYSTNSRILVFYLGKVGRI